MGGRPRFYWLNNTMSRAYKFVLKNKGKAAEPFNIKLKSQREMIAQAALDREHPFDKKHKRRGRTKKDKRERKAKKKPESARCKRARNNKARKNNRCQQKRHKRRQYSSSTNKKEARDPSPP